MAFTAPSQLLERHLEHLHQEDILILNHEHDHFAQDVQQQARSCTALALDYQHYEALQAQDIDHQFGIMLNNHQSQQFDRVIVYFPKAKELADYLCQLAAFYLKENGLLWVVGENKSGIKKLQKQTLDGFSPCQKIDNARHCLLYEAQLQKPLEQFDFKAWQKDFSVNTPQGEIKICALPGVFSQKKLDAGSAFLLEHLQPLKGHVLDFGCGYGVLTCALLKHSPKCKVDCVDINAMALKSCALTLEANQLDARVYPSNGLSQVQQQFDAIISNPPFHDGLKSTLAITEQFIKDCRQTLKPRGTLQIVANRHLAYAQYIEQHFDQVNIIAKNKGYTIYLQTKAGKAGKAKRN
tara:strand:+ start:12774 stop:13829 length:1056 start_codon:yes stop_codon:yes gene_type:complete